MSKRKKQTSRASVSDPTYNRRDGQVLTFSESEEETKLCTCDIRMLAHFQGCQCGGR